MSISYRSYPPLYNTPSRQTETFSLRSFLGRAFAILRTTNHIISRDLTRPTTFTTHLNYPTTPARHDTPDNDIPNSRQICLRPSFHDLYTLTTIFSSTRSPALYDTPDDPHKPSPVTPDPPRHDTHAPTHHGTTPVSLHETHLDRSSPANDMPATHPDTHALAPLPALARRSTQTPSTASPQHSPRDTRPHLPLRPRPLLPTRYTPLPATCVSICSCDVWSVHAAVRQT